MKDYKLSKHVEKVFETPSIDYSEWFGYYNFDTLSSDHSKLLCNRIKEDGIAPQAHIKIEVGYYDIPDGIWHHVGYSDSWNWQQGCMAQWLNDDEIIYNSSKDNHHIAVIHNIKTNEDRIIDWAIYGITPDGKKSISLDMERAHWCRAYHYESVADESKDGAILEEDGIFEIDLVNNKRKRIISIQDIINLDSRPYFSKAKHWLEHIMINPAGTKFCVLHRFSPVDNIYLYVTRLIIVDLKTSHMECIPGWEHTQWSHFGWDGDNFAIYTYPQKGTGINASHFESGKPKVELNVKKKESLKTKIANLIRTIIPEAFERRLRGNLTYYQYYQFINNKYVLKEQFMNDEFLVDGHPSFIASERIMITDSYPHRNGLQYLYQYDVNNKKIKKLGTFNTYYTGNPASCDLHPKVSRDGKYVVVDTAHDAKHHMIVLKLKK